MCTIIVIIIVIVVFILVYIEASELKINMRYCIPKNGQKLQAVFNDNHDVIIDIYRTTLQKRNMMISIFHIERKKKVLIQGWSRAALAAYVIRYIFA